MEVLSIRLKDRLATSHTSNNCKDEIESRYANYGGG